MAKKLHLGFKETQTKIAKKQGISMKAAGAILASSARKASPAAVKKNKALMNVPGVKAYKDGGKKMYTIDIPKLKAQASASTAPKSNLAKDLVSPVGVAKAASMLATMGKSKTALEVGKSILRSAPKGKLEREIAQRTSNKVAQVMAKENKINQVAKKVADKSKASYAKKTAAKPAQTKLKLK